MSTLYYTMVDTTQTATRESYTDFCACVTGLPPFGGRDGPLRGPDRSIAFQGQEKALHLHLGKCHHSKITIRAQGTDDNSPEKRAEY